MRLVFRGVIFLAVLSLVAAVGISYWTKSQGYEKRLESRILENLSTKEGWVAGYQRDSGKFSIERLGGVGSDSVFYTDFVAQYVTGSQGFLEGVAGTWDVRGLKVGELQMNLRAGTGEAVSGEEFSAFLFRENSGVNVTSLEVESTTLTWGYTDATRGKIEGSFLKATPRADGWFLRFEGGTFSQSWLKELKISKLNVFLGPAGVVVEAGELELPGGGSVVLSDAGVRGIMEPVVTGKLTIKNGAAGDLVPPVFDPFLGGRISGELEMSGSTNSREGIVFSGKMEMGEGDGLVLRDRLPLLRALRVVDAFNNYRRVTFGEGGFTVKTGGGTMELSEIELRAGNLMNIRGGVVAKPPSEEERKLLNENIERAFIEEEVLAANRRLDGGLKKEPQVKKTFDAPPTLASRLEEKMEERKVLERAAAGAVDALKYEGELEVSLRGDAFDQAVKLRDEHPVDAGTGRIFLKVPLNGGLESLTLSLAEELEAKGRR